LLLEYLSILIISVLLLFGKEYTANLSSEELVKAIIDDSLQSEAKKRANKIAPISKLEVKKVEF